MDQPEDPKKKRVRVVDLRDHPQITITVNSDQSHLQKLREAIEAINRMNTTIGPNFFNMAPTMEEMNTRMEEIEREIQLEVKKETAAKAATHWEAMKRKAKNHLFTEKNTPRRSR